MSKFDIYVKVSILINYKTKQPSNLAWNISLTYRLCDNRACFSVRLFVRLSVCQHLSKFDIYVKVSILINYKTKQPSNLAWNISLTSRLCDNGARFSIRLSVPPSVCPSVNSSVMSKFDIYVKVSILITTRLNNRASINFQNQEVPDFLPLKFGSPTEKSRKSHFFSVLRWAALSLVEHRFLFQCHTESSSLMCFKNVLIAYRLLKFDRICLESLYLYVGP